MIPAEFADWYQSLQPLVRKISDIVMNTLRQFCNEHHFAVSSRIKRFQSAFEKADSGRFNHLDDFDDLFAATIIVPTLHDEKKVLIFLRSAFDVISERGRSSANKSPEVFRFDSTRIVCRLNRLEDAGDSAPKLCFEVQVRTALEHAWAVTTHPIGYKGPDVNWQILRFCA